MVPIGILELLWSFSFLLLVFKEDSCCTRVEAIVGVTLFNGELAGGLGSDTNFGA